MSEPINATPEEFRKALEQWRKWRKYGERYAEDAIDYIWGSGTVKMPWPKDSE